MNTRQCAQSRRGMICAALLALSVWASFGLAQGARSEPERLFHGVGVVTGIEPAGGVLTIRHKPIEGLMPAMEMSFQTDPPSLIRDVKVGDAIAFDLAGKSYAIKALAILSRGGK